MIPEQVNWQVVTVLALLLNMGGTALAIVRSGRVQKREVSLSSEYVTTKQCGLLHDGSHSKIREIEARVNSLQQRIDHVSGHIGQAVEALRREIKQDMSGIHNRIDQVLQAVSELRGETKHIRG